MNDAIAYFFFGITIISASLVAFSKNVVHAAFASIITVFGVSGLFICLGAEFLGIMLLFVYTGIVLVIILFIVFLTPRYLTTSFRSTSNQLFMGTLITIILMGLLLLIGYKTYWIKPTNFITTTGTEQLGRTFMTAFSLPFEIGALILLASMIGAIMMARRTS